MGPTALYRFYGENDRLLYVGITNNISVRFTQHSQKARWNHLAVRATIQHFETRQEALDEEKSAIQYEYPEFNIVHKLQGENPLEHFNRIFTAPHELTDDFHYVLRVKMSALLSDAWIVNNEMSESKGWAYSNAIWELSSSEDEAEVPCETCIALAWNPLIQNAHNVVCAAYEGKK